MCIRDQLNQMLECPAIKALFDGLNAYSDEKAKLQCENLRLENEIKRVELEYKRRQLDFQHKQDQINDM